MFAVYEVLRNGKHRYMACSATHSEKLAQEIARDFCNGVCVMPDGSTRAIRKRNCIAREI